ncbi:hypothetical protein D7V91_06230 [bacterium 1xD42-67]|nr:hypothetical protein D7V91_06230 [bacterium 1xD42-67]
MFFTKKPAPYPLDIDLYRAGDGTLRLFPCVRMRHGPGYILPEMAVLPPPYTPKEIGRAILDFWDQWADVEPLESMPEKRFWTAVPKCRSYKSFRRGHQLIQVELHNAPEFTIRYMARCGDGSYGQDKGEVEIQAQFHREMPKLPQLLGQAVEKIFALADTFDPLPSKDGP